MNGLRKKIFTAVLSFIVAAFMVISASALCSADTTRVCLTNCKIASISPENISKLIESINCSSFDKEQILDIIESIKNNQTAQDNNNGDHKNNDENNDKNNEDENIPPQKEDDNVTENEKESGKEEADAGTPSDTPENGSENSKGDQTSDLLAEEIKVVELVNEIRASYGLGALKINTQLSNVAREKSNDMKKLNYFSHTSPTYGSPFDMMKAFGITYKTAGENIAMGYASPDDVVDAWMNSDGHRANILGSSYTEIGVGYVADGNYWTQMFIG